MVSIPIDFTVIEDAMQAWLATATGLEAIWRDQSAPQPPYPYASLLIMSGPSRIGGQDENRLSTDLTIFRNVKVTPTAQNDTTYTIELDGTVFAFLSDGDATVAEITAGLVALINADLVLPITATDNGTDIDIVEDAGATFKMVLGDDFDGAQLTAKNNDTGAEVEINVAGLREMTVSTQFYNKKPTAGALSANQSATNFAAIAQASLGLPSVLFALRAAGLAVVSEGDVTNIDQVEADSFISRANLDVIFGLASNLEERVGFIEQVEVSSSSLGVVDRVLGVGS